MKIKDSNKTKIKNDSKSNKKDTNFQIRKMNLYKSIFYGIKGGLTIKQICKKYDLKRTNAQHYINAMKKANLIKNIGYGIYEITKLGLLISSIELSSSLRGGRKGLSKVELWRMGYRYVIKYDNNIKELRKQRLKNKGYVFRGFINSCYVSKGNGILDIFGSVAKSDNLYDASMKAMNEIVHCKAYIEDNYFMRLIPKKPLKPDILINTPETKRIANTIYKEFGRIRTQYIDIDTSKKKDKNDPDFEAKTIKSANTILDNISVENKGEEIIREIRGLKDLLKEIAHNKNKEIGNKADKD